MLVAPKDGHLYGFDLDTKEMLYRLPVTAIENVDVPFSPQKSVHFCPGSIGGAEWNGPAYNPQNNLVMIGEVQWCTTVRVDPVKVAEQTPKYTPWSAEDSINPYNMWGKADPAFDWAGWLYAVGAGVITFQTPRGQRVAAATGLTEVLWPTEITTAKVSILGLE